MTYRQLIERIQQEAEKLPNGLDQIAQVEHDNDCLACISDIVIVKIERGEVILETEIWRTHKN